MTHPFHPSNVGWRGFIESMDSPGLRIIKNKNEISPLSLSLPSILITTLTVSPLYLTRDDPFESMEFETHSISTRGSKRTGNSVLSNVTNVDECIGDDKHDQRREIGTSVFYSE